MNYPVPRFVAVTLDRPMAFKSIKLSFRKSRLALIALLGAQLALSGCADLARDYLRWPGQVEDQTDFRRATVGRAWVNVPNMTLVMQRDLFPYGVEQRISLRNPTTVTGDNMMILRSRKNDSGAGRLRYEEFMRRIGGAPAPFNDLNSGELLSGEDSMGTYFWTERRYGSSTLCVLAIRRVSMADRQMPGNADAMDLMLRNCVLGSVEEALAPAMDQSLSVGRSASGGLQGESRLLSPLAGPTRF